MRGKEAPIFTRRELTAPDLGFVRRKMRATGRGLRQLVRLWVIVATSVAGVLTNGTPAAGAEHQEQAEPIPSFSIRQTSNNMARLSSPASTPSDTDSHASPIRRMQWTETVPRIFPQPPLSEPGLPQPGPSQPPLGPSQGILPNFAQPIYPGQTPGGSSMPHSGLQGPTPSLPFGSPQGVRPPIGPSVGPIIGGQSIAPSPIFVPEYAPRRIRFRPRNADTPPQVQIEPSETGDSTVVVIKNGINVIIDGIDQLGTVDLVADRVVIWITGGMSNLSMSGTTELASGQPFEMYLEGDIEFRQADRVIQANSMYYNVAQQTGVVLAAEMLTSVPDYEGLVRMKAEVLRQVNGGSFQAFNAALTTSRLGMPRYWFQAENMTFDQRVVPRVDPSTGQLAMDPMTGQPILDRERLAVSQGNFVYVAGIPIFYIPSLKTDFTSPGFYIDSIKLGNDRVFGTQVRVDFDLNRVFGLQPEAGNQWTGSVDYLSKRGWGLGTNYRYLTEKFLFLDGLSSGVFDAWGINEQGLDNLGADRRQLTPEEDFRYRVLWQHRQHLRHDWRLTAEVGLISDRNFLEQYYEQEWDQWKDQTTGFQLKRLIDNSSWNILSDVRVNDFFTQTQWLPRLDHYLIGQPIFGNRFTWSSHSNVGYADLKTADAPKDPVELSKFNQLAWETETKGIRAGTRNELALPLPMGASKVVPYVAGEAMYWGEALDGNDLTRLHGQAGVRWSLPLWRVDPNRRSTMFNVNGLAHKIVFDSEFLYADADQNIDQLPLYDPLDDDSIEHFRRRFIDDTFSGTAFVDDDVPLKFDERFYALRTGMQRWVTAPVPEIADDLMLFQFGARQRWQTKRGAPGRERIIDWITLDTHATFFPKADRDNFGEDIGLLNYDFRWHVGDRLTLLSDGYADTFGDGLRMLTVGGYMGRPERGSLYLGFRSIGGPISSSILVGSFNYRMSQKWIASGATAIDFGPAGNIGQRFELTRIGESFLVSLGVNVDESRDNVGVGFSIEPRFLPLTRKGLVGGIQVPPAGVRGLE